MRIGFYAPFKPLTHPNPSGDQTIAKGLVSTFQQQGHQVLITSDLRCRWIYWHPAQLMVALREHRRLSQTLPEQQLDCWFTYHSYYKSPDILGPGLSRQLGIPYIIQQPSYATKFKRRWKTLPGFFLNRRALQRADILITDRKRDLVNLQRIASADKLRLVKPGIAVDRFHFSQKARQELRKQWQIPPEIPVLCTAAMFRDDVKSEGIAWVIDCCQKLVEQQVPFHLVIIGDGVTAHRLQRKANQLPVQSYRFVGKVEHDRMYQYFSAADLFAFPGFNESLGMVFLEAQSCGLPVIACDNGGIPEIMRDRETGFLIPLGQQDSFVQHIRLLLENEELRQQLSRAARTYVQTYHDQQKNAQHIGQIVAEAKTLLNRRQ